MRGKLNKAAVVAAVFAVTMGAILLTEWLKP